LKTVFESICGLWGQTALKEKEIILGEDAPRGLGRQGSMVTERSGSPSQPLQMKVPELGRLSASLDLLAAQVEAIEEVDDTDLVPLVYRKRARESQPSEVVGSTSGMQDLGVHNSIIEPVDKYIIWCYSMRKVENAKEEARSARADTKSATDAVKYLQSRLEQVTEDMVAQKNESDNALADRDNSISDLQKQLDVARVAIKTAEDKSAVLHRENEQF
ncbi:hypothetical protein Droror1_Dr00017306, partial [Drosera rotundifolia]